MDIHCVTIATGSPHTEVLELTKPLFESSTGLTTNVITSAADPFREKLRLLSEVTVNTLYWDADCVFRKPWYVSSAFDGALRMSVGRAIDPMLGCTLYSTGIVLSGPEHSPLFRRALELYDNTPSSERVRYDEGPLSLAIASTGHKVSVLDDAFNFPWIGLPSRPFPDDAVVVHCLADAHTKLRRVKRASALERD